MPWKVKTLKRERKSANEWEGFSWTWVKVRLSLGKDYIWEEDKPQIEFHADKQPRKDETWEMKKDDV